MDMTSEPESGTEGKRPYQMTARRDAAERNRQRVLEAAYGLWLRDPYDEVTLDSIAEAAGVARQTVHRQFGSKEALFARVIDWVRPREEVASFSAEPGDIASAVRVQVDRYERMGDALVRFLQLEGRIAPVDALLAHGRRSHEAEIEHAFGPYLPPHGSLRVEAVTALYATTDVMVWKLLRRDFGHTREQAERIIRRLVDGVLATLPAPSQPAPSQPAPSQPAPSQPASSQGARS
jgi:AcrR family transcriptional regulator